MDLPGIVYSVSDGVLKPKVVASRVAGLSPYNFLHFWPCIMVRGPVEERKKESRVSGGVYQLARGIITSYFQYLDRAVREKRSGGILTQRHRVSRQCTTKEGLGGKDRTLRCVMCQGKVFWGERLGYTMACAATTEPRWKVSRDLCDKSLR